MVGICCDEDEVDSHENELDCNENEVDCQEAGLLDDLFVRIAGVEVEDIRRNLSVLSSISKLDGLHIA